MVAMRFRRAMNNTCRPRSGAECFFQLDFLRASPVSHGTAEVSVPSTEWVQDAETGKARYVTSVMFDEKFQVPPKVVAGLCALEIGDGPPARLEVRLVENSVTRDGFVLQFTTRPGSNVLSAAAFWLAMER